MVAAEQGLTLDAAQTVAVARLETTVRHGSTRNCTGASGAPDDTRGTYGDSVNSGPAGKSSTNSSPTSPTASETAVVTTMR